MRKTAITAIAAIFIVIVVMDAIPGIFKAMPTAFSFDVRQHHDGEVRVTGEVKQTHTVSGDVNVKTSGEVKTRVVNPPVPPPAAANPVPDQRSFMERQGLNPDGSVIGEIGEEEADTDPQASPSRSETTVTKEPPPAPADRVVVVETRKSRRDYITDAIVGVAGPAIGGAIARGGNRDRNYDRGSRSCEYDYHSQHTAFRRRLMR